MFDCAASLLGAAVDGAADCADMSLLGTGCVLVVVLEVVLDVVALCACISLLDAGGVLAAGCWLMLVEVLSVVLGAVPAAPIVDCDSFVASPALDEVEEVQVSAMCWRLETCSELEVSALALLPLVLEEAVDDALLLLPGVPVMATL